MTYLVANNTPLAKILRALVAEMQLKSKNLDIEFGYIRELRGELIYSAGIYCPWIGSGSQIIKINRDNDNYPDYSYMDEIGTLLHEHGHHENVETPLFYGTKSKTGHSYAGDNSNYLTFKEELFAWKNGLVFVIRSNINIYYKMLITLSFVSRVFWHMWLLFKQYFAYSFLNKKRKHGHWYYERD
jgi:hypothetical protein